MHQNRYRSHNGDRRMSYRGKAQHEQNYRGRSPYIQNYRSDFRRGNFRGMQNYRGQNFRGGYRGNFRNDNFGRGISRYRERQYSGRYRRNEQSSCRFRSGSRASTTRDRIRCFKCRGYDHFTKDCPNVSHTEKEQSEQIQQMLNFEDDKTVLKVLAADTYDDLIRTSLEEAIDHLN